MGGGVGHGPINSLNAMDAKVRKGRTRKFGNTGMEDFR